MPISSAVIDNTHYTKLNTETTYGHNVEEVGVAICAVQHIQDKFQTELLLHCQQLWHKVFYFVLTQNGMY